MDPSYFLFILNDLKCYRSATWSSKNHLWTLIVIKNIYKEFFRCSVTDLCNECLVVCFFEFLTPFTLGAITFSILIHFWQLSVCQMQQEEGFKFWFRRQKQWSAPLGSGLPWVLKYSVTSRSTLNIKHLENPENWCQHDLISWKVITKNLLDTLWGFWNTNSHLGKNRQADFQKGVKASNSHSENRTENLKGSCWKGENHPTLVLTFGVPVSCLWVELGMD